MLIGVPYSFTEPASQRARKAQSDEIGIDGGPAFQGAVDRNKFWSVDVEIEYILIEAEDL